MKKLYETLFSITLFLIASSSLTFAQSGHELTAQKRDSLKLLVQRLKEIESEKTNIFNQFNSIWNSPTTNDSIRVEIARLINKHPDSMGLGLLIEHIGDVFAYGDGGSDTDQFNTYITFLTLSVIGNDRNLKWYLIHPIFNALKIGNRSETFILRLSTLLVSISNQEMAKFLLESELQKNKHWTIRNPTYEANLLLMLKQIQ